MSPSSQLFLLTDAANKTDVKINFIHIRKTTMILRAINHKLRQQILRLLDDERKVSVTDIYVKLRLEQSVASQHLAILRRAGVVKTHREGKFIYYTVNYARTKEINDFVEKLVG